jgi:hypothetical protein
MTNSILTVKRKPKPPVFSARKKEYADFPNLWHKYFNKVWKTNLPVCRERSQTQLLSLSSCWSRVNSNVGGSPIASENSSYRAETLLTESKNGVKRIPNSVGKQSFLKVSNKESTIRMSSILLNLSNLSKSSNNSQPVCQLLKTLCGLSYGYYFSMVLSAYSLLWFVQGFGLVLAWS